VGGQCGDAVNPSMGAWPRHPCRGHPALPTHPAAGRFRVRHPRKRKRRSRAKAAWPPLHCFPRDPLLIFFFFSVGGRPPKSVRGRSGWVRGGVRGMDAAAKPPWTDSRRPPRTQPDRPPRLLLPATTQTPPTRGCAVGWKLSDVAQCLLWKRSHNNAKQYTHRPKSAKSVSWFTLLHRVDLDQWTCRNRPAQWRPVRHGAPSIVAARGGVGREAVLIQRVQGARGTATGERQPRRYRPDPVAGCVCGDGDATGNLSLNGEARSRRLHISR